jgi:hypothetical protein
VKAADDEAVPVRVGQRESEALVATGLLEWIEPDERHPLDRPAAIRLEDGGPGRQLVQLARDGEDLVEVRVEDRLEASALCPAGHPFEPPAELAQPKRLAGNEQEQQQDDGGQAEDDQPEIRRDESVQIDRTVLRQAS